MLNFQRHFGNFWAWPRPSNPFTPPSHYLNPLPTSAPTPSTTQSRTQTYPQQFTQSQRFFFMSPQALRDECRAYPDIHKHTPLPNPLRGWFDMWQTRCKQATHTELIFESNVWLWKNKESLGPVAWALTLSFYLSLFTHVFISLLTLPFLST